MLKSSATHAASTPTAPAAHFQRLPENCAVEVRSKMIRRRTGLRMRAIPATWHFLIGVHRRLSAAMVFFFERCDLPRRLQYASYADPSRWRTQVDLSGTPDGDACVCREGS